MARNKYPELTVEKILEVSQRLFLEKGYEQTTIQDIVDNLGGLTKGAVYHHFKSKEEIINALGDKMYLSNNPFNVVKEQNELNGLQKIQKAMMLNQEDSERATLSKKYDSTIGESSYIGWNDRITKKIPVTRVL